MKILELLVTKSEKMLEWIVIVLMALLVMDVCWQVLTRFALEKPSAFTEEIARFMLIWISFLGAALAYRKNMHLGLDIMTRSLTGAKKVIAEIVSHACVLVFALVLILFGGYSLVELTALLPQYSPSLGIPVAYVYAFIPLSGLLFALYAIHFLAECFTELFSHQPKSNIG